MLFPTITFAVFILVVLPLHWILRPFPTPWRWFILSASYLFYGWVDWRYLLLLVGSTLVNSLLASRIDRALTDGGRRRLLIAAVVANLAVLGWFKYYGFFVTSFVGAAGRIGITLDPPLVQVLLPIGISFYTFQALSYVIDVYRRKLQPAPTLDFAVYLAFFPQIVAGPIVRATELLPQFNAYLDPRRIDGARAFWLITVGLAKKLVLADFLAGAIVNPVFDAPSAHSAPEIVVAVLAYAVQIYCDFSAYSDIAIGLGLLMGFRLPENFNAPYTAVSIQDFWHRWHMTLSRWLRDYVYIPLGGNQHGERRTEANLLLTMLLGGLWHGASWTFVFWGGLHGAGLALERRRALDREQRGRPPYTDRVWRARIGTFAFVCLGWVFFRADSFATAAEILWRGLTAWGPAPLVTPGVLLAIAVGIGAEYVPRSSVARVWAAWSRVPVAAQGLSLGATLLVIDAMGPTGVADFIYFRF